MGAYRRLLNWINYIPEPETPPKVTDWSVYRAAIERDPRINTNPYSGWVEKRRQIYSIEWRRIGAVYTGSSEEEVRIVLCAAMRDMEFTDAIPAMRKYTTSKECTDG